MQKKKKKKENSAVFRKTQKHKPEFNLLLNNTENVLTNLCTEHVQSTRPKTTSTLQLLKKLYNFWKIYIFQSTEITAS